MEPRPRTVADAGEAEVIAVFAGPVIPSDGDLVAHGDDAAVLGPAAATVLTTDLLVEGTHFRRDLMSPRDIGERAVAQNLADVIAMGARCTRLLVGVCLPPETLFDDAAELAAGIHDAASDCGAVVIGGDVTTGGVIVVSITAVGELPGGAAPLPLGGARVGDTLALTGRPGRAAAGLELLDAAEDPLTADGACERAYRVPTPPPWAGAAARAAGAHALTDVSDGLLRDAGAMASASGAAIDLDSAALDGDPELDAAAEALGHPAEQVLSWQLTGGEDHGLLGAFPPGAAVPEEFRVVGRVVDGAAGQVRVDGAEWDSGGWDSLRGLS